MIPRLTSHGETGREVEREGDLQSQSGGEVTARRGGSIFPQLNATTVRTHLCSLNCRTRCVFLEFVASVEPRCVTVSSCVLLPPR